MLYDWRWVHGWGLFKLTATRGSACRRRRWRRASRSSRPCRAAEPGGPAPRRSGTASSRGPWRRPRSASLLPRRRRRRRRRYRRLRWTPARLSRLSRWTPAGWRCWSWRVWLAAAPTIRSPAAAAAAAAPLVAVWEKWWRRRWATLVVHSSSNFDERDSKLHTRTHTHTHTHTDAATTTVEVKARLADRRNNPGPRSSIIFFFFLRDVFGLTSVSWHR